MCLSSWVSMIKTIAHRSFVRKANSWNKGNAPDDFLCPYITLLFKPTISPTLQAPLACNQWQHLLQCCSATGQYIQQRCWQDYTPIVTVLRVKIHLWPADSVQAMKSKWTNRPKRGGNVNTAESMNAMHFFSVTRDTHSNPPGNNEHHSAHIPFHYVKQQTISSLLMQFLLTLRDTSTHPC